MLVCVIASAQDQPAPAKRRPARGAEGTREFLGLGPAPDEAAAKKGEPIYQQNCGMCHGPTGRGAQAPNLLRSVTVLHDEKGEEIGPVVKNGRPQSGMPAFPDLSKDDIYDISQFLKQQIELTANRGTYNTQYSNLRNQTSGDPKKGEAFFNGAGGCAKCHSVTGDLAKIGDRFPQPALMQARLLWPASRDSETVTVTTPAGENITGKVQTLNDFDLSLRDSSGQYHYFRVPDVKIHHDDKLAGHRALLPKYTDAEIHDLAAYLVTLK